MTTNRLRPMAFRFAIGTVIGAALLAGTAYGDAGAKSAPQEETARLNRSDEKAVLRAERAVAKAPRDAALRTELGHAYLRAGRFPSARTAFTDAVTLGDSSARTMLGLALANVAEGRNSEALAILNSTHKALPASDLGLAVALAGQTDRGVAILVNALRSGDNSPKLRQNLAYAYALNGAWREARIMMTQDVPAEQLDARLTQWAASGRRELFHQRVAALLGAPVRTDLGMPQQLALNTAPPTAPATAELTPDPVPAAELPPLEREVAAAPATPVPPAAEPAYSPAATPVPLQDFVPALSASTGSVLSAPTPAPVAGNRSLAAFDEFARPVSSTLSAVAADRGAPAGIRARAVVAHTATGGSHVVQLGAFSSEQNARRGWNVLAARNPALQGSRMVITRAVVNGRNFWRVAAASYDPATARGLCFGIKARGGVCFSYATSGPRRNLLMARTEVPTRGGLALR